MQNVKNRYKEPAVEHETQAYLINYTQHERK